MCTSAMHAGVEVQSACSLCSVWRMCARADSCGAPDGLRALCTVRLKYQYQREKSDIRSVLLLLDLDLEAVLSSKQHGTVPFPSLSHHLLGILPT